MNTRSTTPRWRPVAAIGLCLAGCAPEVELSPAGATGTSSPTSSASTTSTGSTGSGDGGHATSSTTTSAQGGASGVGGAGPGGSGQGGEGGSVSSGLGAAPCLGVSYRVVYFDGDPGESVHPGADLIVDAKWTAEALELDHFGVYLIPMDYDQGSHWMLDFGTQQMGQDLAIGLYPDAMRWPFEDPGKPGMAIAGNGIGCNTLSGEFEVLELELSGDQISKLTVRFLQHCGGWMKELRGCVHWE